MPPSFWPDVNEYAQEILDAPLVLSLNSLASQVFLSLILKNKNPLEALLFFKNHSRDFENAYFNPDIKQAVEADKSMARAKQVAQEMLSNPNLDLARLSFEELYVVLKKWARFSALETSLFKLWVLDHKGVALTSGIYRVLSRHSLSGLDEGPFFETDFGGMDLKEGECQKMNVALQNLANEFCFVKNPDCAHCTLRFHLEK